MTVSGKNVLLRVPGRCNMTQEEMEDHKLRCTRSIQTAPCRFPVVSTLCPKLPKISMARSARCALVRQPSKGSVTTD